MFDMTHRAYPPPTRPWVMHMTWRHLLFAHWPIPLDALRPHVPESLDIDTFDGVAWLGVVPFLMDDTRPRALPGLPTATTFPELNVRTYVTPKHDPAMPGVWFFSLDAASRLAVAMARRFFHLQYFRADMSCDATDTGVKYRSTRTHTGAPPASFEAAYAPTAPPTPSQPGSLEHFLTERFCLYAADSATLYRGHIHHAPWPLRPASAEIACCDMTGLLGLSLPDIKPLLHAVDKIKVVAWPLERVRMKAN